MRQTAMNPKKIYSITVIVFENNDVFLQASKKSKANSRYKMNRINHM